MDNINWRQVIKDDLAPFADTAADGPRISWEEAEAGRLKATWSSQDHELTAIFLVDQVSRRPSVEFRGRTLDYKSFLADANVGGLYRLAERLAAYHKDFPYVQTLAGTSDPTESPRPAIELIAAKLDEPPSDFTEVLFLTGEAGAGKTSSLRRLTIARANAYRAGDASSIYLYVNAQGRALATFDQALSVELDDLRSQLTYDMIAPLVRNDLLVPLVDGFDELLGSSYDDSFSSLSRFLGTLHGRGRIVACARSAYYEQEFLARIGKESAGGLTWQVERVEMKEWDVLQRGKLIELRCGAAGTPERTDEVAEAAEELLRSDDLREIAGKPFFVDKIAQLLIERRQLPSHQSAFVGLVDAYLERETGEKLLDADRRPLMTPQALSSILTELASEMWILETRQLPPDTVREVVAMVLEDIGLRGQIQEYLHMRGPMLGFLTSSSAGKRVEFEHELMFSFFLGLAFANELQHGNRLAWLLPRGVLPARVAQLAVQSLFQNGGTDAALVSGVCAASASLELREDQARVNAGTLVMAAATVSGTAERWQVHDVNFGGGAAGAATFADCNFERVAFYRADLTRVKLVRCHATDVSLLSVLVDKSTTRLELSGIDPVNNIFGLRQVPSDEEMFVPDEIVSVLRECGMPYEDLDATQVAPPVPSIVMDFMQKFARAFSRTNLVWPDDPDKRWMRSDVWPEVRELLIREGLLIEERRESKGLQRAAVRGRFEVTELMRGAVPGASVSKSIQRFWTSLRARYVRAGE